MAARSPGVNLCGPGRGVVDVARRRPDPEVGAASTMLPRALKVSAVVATASSGAVSHPT